MDYIEFLQSKRHSSSDFGITPNLIPDQMFDFQKYISEYLIKKGRAAGFIDTGLGKTIIELFTAVNYIHHTNKPVLIITPLAVAFQFIKEASKFGIDDIEYSRDGRYTKKLLYVIMSDLISFYGLTLTVLFVTNLAFLKILMEL